MVRFVARDNSRKVGTSVAPNPLRSHIRDWQEMANVDPFRAISGQNKQWNVDEFFATAKPHMDQLFSAASGLGLPRAYERAVEFGCGAGRFLPHFEKRFKEVWGADVSQEMIDSASQYNPRCRFHLVTGLDLQFFPDNHFDLIYSFLVLQHLPNKSAITGYIKEFMRILRPGGLAAFQLPDRLNLRWRIQPRRRAYQLLHALGVGGERLQAWGLLPMRLTALPKETVESVVTGVGCRVLRVDTLGLPEEAMYYIAK